MTMLTQLRWILLAGGAAWACHMAVQHGTPPDRSLPLLGVVVTLLAAVSNSVIAAAVPLLVVAELTIQDETVRLLALGVIVASSFVAAVSVRPAIPEDRRALFMPRHARDAAPLVAIAAIVVLRWIPLSEISVGRELFLLGTAALTVLALGRTPLAIAIAVVSALVTPAIPLRTLALPLIVLSVALLARRLGMPPAELAWPSAIVLAFVLLFFSWSGVVARGPSWFLRQALPAVAEVPVRQALGPGESVLLEVPAGVSTLVVSGANASRLARGALLGRIEPGGREIRIGEVADWGYMRREQFFGSRNPLPDDPAGVMRGYGQTAWVDGAGRIALPPGAATIRITADPALREASLQIERFELSRR